MFKYFQYFSVADTPVTLVRVKLTQDKHINTCFLKEIGSLNHVILTKIGKDCQNREKLFKTPSSHFLLESSTSYLNDRKNFVERERSLRKTLQKVPLSLQRTIVRNGRARGGRKREPNSSKVLEFINFPRMQNELPFNKFCTKNIHPRKPQNEEISI